MDQEERTSKLLDLGYLVNINVNLWSGSVMVYPEDLGVGKQMLPLGRQSMQVMSKPWITMVTLKKERARHSLGFRQSHLLNFDGGRHRFVLKGAADAVAESLDKQADMLKKIYDEVYANERETKRIARQVISKNSVHMWKTVSHLFPKHNGDKVPDDWKAEMIETVMANRFPSKAQISSSGLSYSIFKSVDALPLIRGRHQKPFPGLVTSSKTLNKDVNTLPKVLHARLLKRVPIFLKDQKSGGIHAVTLLNLKRDIDLYEAFNPIPVNGFGMEEAWSDVHQFIGDLNPLHFRERKIYREELAQYLLTICRILQGPWADQRSKEYEGVFGGG